MAFDAYMCLFGARPSRVYVRYVARQPKSSVPAAEHGTRPCRVEEGVQVNHDASSEVTHPCRVEVGAQVNHGAWPLG